MEIEDTQNNLADAVKEHLEKGRRKILLNLANVNYIDSSGIGDLIMCLLSVQKQSGALKLLKPQPNVCTLLMTQRLGPPIFEMFQDEEEAIRSFRD